MRLTKVIIMLIVGSLNDVVFSDYIVDVWIVLGRFLMFVQIFFVVYGSRSQICLVADVTLNYLN